MFGGICSLYVQYIFICLFFQRVCTSETSQSLSVAPDKFSLGFRSTASQTAISLQKTPFQEAPSLRLFNPGKRTRMGRGKDSSPPGLSEIFPRQCMRTRSLAPPGPAKSETWKEMTASYSNFHFIKSFFNYLLQVLHLAGSPYLAFAARG